MAIFNYNLEYVFFFVIASNIQTVNVAISLLIAIENPDTMGSCNYSPTKLNNMFSNFSSTGYISFEFLSI